MSLYKQAKLIQASFHFGMYEEKHDMIITSEEFISELWFQRKPSLKKVGDLGFSSPWESWGRKWLQLPR
jgi:hypothetical protein